MAWINNDGLRVKFGTEEGQVGKAGEYAITGPVHVVEVLLSDLTTLGTDAAILDYDCVIPEGARIERVEIITQTAATSGGSAVLNIGLVDKADFTTAIDADGLVAAAALATFNSAGERVTLNVGSTGAGALIGTTLSANGVLCADYDTAAFTAGAVRVRVEWVKPLS